uniref:Uncharacterized protein n=1 Tax=Panagrolaimus sp. ES5 TaxID=591445 RepID=A0AC34G1W1_9BILA
MILEAGISEERIHSVKGPVSDENVLKALIEETVEKFGKLDILINNVGIANKEGISDRRSMENLDYVLNVNLKSVIQLTELAISHLEKSKGNIVCVSSIAALHTSPSHFYGIAKAGLDHFVRNYAAILAPSGVRINTLNPGATETNFFARQGFTQENLNKFKDHFPIPLGRWASPIDMANTIIFMASENASYMTGQNIVVDGGVLIKSAAIK